MAVAFDAAGSAQEVAGDGVLSLTFTASGSNRCVQAANVVTKPNRDTQSITYGGVDMGSAIYSADNGTIATRAQAFVLVAPATGAQTVTATCVSTGPDSQVLGVVSMTGVDQTTPNGTAVTAFGDGAGSGPATVTVGSVGASDLVVDCVIISTNGSITIGANQLQEWSQVVSAADIRGSIRNGSDGGVMSWDISGESGLDWAIGAVAFKAQTAAPDTLMGAQLSG